MNLSSCETVSDKAILYFIFSPFSSVYPLTAKMVRNMIVFINKEDVHSLKYAKALRILFSG